MVRSEKVKLLAGIIVFLGTALHAGFYLSCDYGLYWLLSMIRFHGKLKTANGSKIYTHALRKFNHNFLFSTICSEQVIFKRWHWLRYFRIKIDLIVFKFWSGFRNKKTRFFPSNQFYMTTAYTFELKRNSSS